MIPATLTDTDKLMMLQMVGLPSQTVETELLRVEDNVAIVKNEYAENGESRFRLSDGRSLDENNRPTNWNFWQLSARDRRRLMTKVKVE